MWNCIHYPFILLNFLCIIFILNFLKCILFLMLLQLSQFFPLCPPPPCTPIPSSHAPPVSSCPWVIHISSLATPFPILFLTSPCLFCTFQFVLLSTCFFFLILSSLLPSQLITLQMISISMILLLFCLFA